MNASVGPAESSFYFSKSAPYALVSLLIFQLVWLVASFSLEKKKRLEQTAIKPLSSVGRTKYKQCMMVPLGSIKMRIGSDNCKQIFFLKRIQQQSLWDVYFKWFTSCILYCNLVFLSPWSFLLQIRHNLDLTCARCKKNIFGEIMLRSFIFPTCSNILQDFTDWFLVVSNVLHNEKYWMQLLSCCAFLANCRQTP